MNQGKAVPEAIGPEKKRDPVPQRYLERLYEMAEKVYNDEQDGIIVLRDRKRGRRMFIGEVEW